MNIYDYYVYGYADDTVRFIPMYCRSDYNIDAETVEELKKQVDEIVNGKTDNGKIDTFAEVGEALDEVENKIPEMTALTSEEIIKADDEE